MGKIVVGCWDCDYCGADRISGEIKICPHCGKPRGKDITFYMAGPKHYVEDPDKVNKNPDWLCSYCNTLNPDENKFCSACGASREDSELNYFQNKEAEKKKEQELKEKLNSEKPQTTRSGGRSRLPLLLGIAAALALLIFMMMPKTKGLQVDSKTWERTIAIERYQEVQENGWTLPEDAWDVTTRQEVYSYNQVLDHYETVEREVAEEVFDGYDTEVEYKDLGNGHFEEIEHQVPRYRTEYHTETYQEPVYIAVPVYETKYYYSIMKWKFDRDEITEGADTEPYFAELDLPETERELERIERYWIISDGHTYKISYDLWQQVEKGTRIKAVVQNGEILELEN